MKWNKGSKFDETSFSKNGDCFNFELQRCSGTGSTGRYALTAKPDRSDRTAAKCQKAGQEERERINAPNVNLAPQTETAEAVQLPKEKVSF